MYRIKRARSVIHSLAHHAVSALSFLHPRLGEECLQSGLTEVKFDLIAELITGKEFKGSKETMSAYNALKATFEQILQSEGMDLSCIKTASINFGFKKDSWPSFCICTMTGLGTEPIHIKVDWCGNKYNLLSEC